MFRRWLSTRSLIRTTALLLVGAWISIPSPTLAQNANTGRPQQLIETYDLLPAEFELIIAVPDLSTLSDRAAMINDALDLKITGLTDLLSEFKRAMGMDRGVNGKGSMFLVVQNLESLLPPPPVEKNKPAVEPIAPVFAALIPVSDYAEFTANFGGSADNQIATLKLPNGQTAFSKVNRGYAIISANKKVVEDYNPGMTRANLSQLIGESGTKVLIQSDISLILKPGNLSDRAYQQLVDLLKPAPSVPNATDSKSNVPGNSQIMADLYNAAMLRMLKDSSTLVLGLGNTVDAMNVNVAMQFKPGSDMANRLTGTAGTAQIMDRLPRRSYLYSFDINTQQVGLRQILDDTAAQLMVKGTWYTPLINQAAPLLEQIQEASQVFFAPHTAIGLGSHVMNTVMILKVKDSQSFVSSFEQLLTSINNKQYPLGLMLKGETAETDTRPRVTVTSQFAANALADDRAQIAQYQFNYVLPMTVMARMSDVSQRMMMLNLNNQEGYIAIVDPTTVVLTTAIDAQIMKDTLTQLMSAEANGLGKIPQISHANENGVDAASGQLHADVLATMRTTQKLIEMLKGKQDSDPVFPDTLMPLSLSFKTFNGALQARIRLPLETLAYLRGDAQTVLAPLMPKSEVDPNDPNATAQRQPAPGMENEEMMQRGGMPGEPGGPNMPGMRPRRTNIPNPGAVPF